MRTHASQVLLAKKIDLDTNELLAELSAPLRGEAAAAPPPRPPLHTSLGSTHTPSPHLPI